MYLKSIEMQGFKSFANKMTLKFHKGITGIVGPNGSGKSNVADAVRWVLGEQSAKQLRGSKMEDVIFSGTESRKPLGFAYVAITLDNSDHKLSIPYDEVTIARRVYRSGESEYLINGSTCRLRDVQELFFDTGIGKEGYSIIGQGQIDKILSGKPEERRELFDEAAGIVKFKKRKHAAQKNLEAERQNLYRVNDILMELEKQLGPLKRQSETAREYLKMRDHQKALDVNLYLMEYVRTKDALKEVSDKIEIVTADIETTNNTLEQTKAQYQRLEEELEVYNAHLDEKRNVYNEGKLNKERIEGELRLVAEQMNTIRSNVENGELRIAQIRQSIESRMDEMKEQEAIINEIVLSMKSLNAKRQGSDEKLGTMTLSIEQLRQTIDSKNADIIECLNEASGVKGKIGRYDTMEEQIHIRKAELTQRLLVLQSEETSKSEAVGLYENELKQVLMALEAGNTKLEKLNKRNSDISVQLNEVRSLVGSAQQEFHAVNSRYAALRNISERYEGYGNSIKKVMEQKRSNAGIVGVVADIIKVDKSYETAIEIALGGSIQNIVTEDEPTAKKLIQYLKENRLGRATFLPLTSITSKGNAVPEGALKEDGIIGLGSDLVKADKRFSHLVDYLLGRIVVAKDIDKALALAKKYKYSLRIVTLDGESLSPGGSLSGGAYKNNSNLLGRSRELSELSEKIEQIKQRIDELNQKQAHLQEERNHVRKDIDDVSRKLQELSLSENTVRMTLNQAKTDRDASADTYAQLSAENNELNDQLTTIASSKLSLEAELKGIEANRVDTESLVETLNDKLDQLILEERRFTEENAGLRLKISEFNQKKQFASENIRRITGEIEEFNATIEAIREDMGNAGSQLEERQKICDEHHETMNHLDSVINDAQADMTVLNEKREAISKVHKQFFTKREELSDRKNVLDKEQMRLDHQREKLEEEKLSQSNYMWQEYELTYSSACSLKDEELSLMSQSALKKAVADQKSAIKKLGPVNVNAIDEYVSVSERYELLKTQHDDLVEAENKLTGIIDSLDKAMRAQFAEKFKEIAVNFDRVFKELFGGGKGTLELMEDEDILYCGIRIIASPPGKKLQNMMQLSGGEKALTAIALLFAIQSLKPSPFCLLDEIEAALDDANVKRYAQYLNNLTKDTQFIIITHRRGTMNAADTLYGITMQEKGVSTLVSVSLIDSKLDD